MASYLLALQLRAAELTVKSDMPRRALATRILLFCEVLSTMLVVQVGQFTHPAFSLFPLLILAIVARNWADEGSEARSLDPRSILATVLAPAHYSTFGLCKGQKSAVKHAAAMVSVRLLCFILLMGIVANRKCSNGYCEYECSCNLGWTENEENQWYCPGSSVPGFLKFLMRPCGTDNYVPLVDFGPLCNIMAGGHFFYSDCTLDGLMPALLEPSCKANEIDQLAFYQCHTSWPSLLSSVCAGQFIVCAAQSGELRLQKLLVLIYIFVPSAALVLLILVHGVGHFFVQPPLMGVDADKTLRKQIKRQAMDFRRQLENGNLNESLMCGRSQLVMKLAFFLVDILLDITCLASFLRSGLWHFAACQSVIFLVCAFFQVRTACNRNLLKEVVDSWTAGIPTNVVLKMLLEEKTFEAPLSLFLQYFSSFWVMKDEAAFASLWMSMFFSVLGISGGLYTAGHLSIIDLEDLEEIEISVVSCDVTPQTVGQANDSYPNTHPEPDPAKALNLPPPPGLGPPGLDSQPGPKRAGQFASATE